MEEKKFKATKRTIPLKILGRTYINHEVRCKLNLTCDEYNLMDFIFSWQTQKPKERIKFKDLYVQAGITKPQLTGLFASLKQKKMVFQDEKKIVRTAVKWNKFFSDVDHFEELWNKYARYNGQVIGNKGNKQKAKEVFNKAIKIVSAKKLIVAAEKYTAHCATTETYIKNCSSWLNPNYQYWNDELIEKPDNSTKEKPISDNLMDGRKT